MTTTHGFRSPRFADRVATILCVLVFLAAAGAGCPGDDGATLDPQRAEAAASVPSEAVTPPSDITGERDRWMEHCLAWVAAALKTHPPSVADRDARRAILTVLDDPIHVTDAPQIDAVGEFFQVMARRAIAGIESETVSEGAVVWKIYNHFFVIKTSHHTYAFDFCRGAGKASLTQTQVDRLVAAIDVLFISHRHADHADLSVAQKVLAAGKPVVVPTEMWQDEDIAGALTRVTGGDATTVSGLDVTVFPGGQLSVPNNVYLVAADGVSVMHTGDQQQYGEAAKWLQRVGADQDVDILLPNCWTPDLPEMVKMVVPRVVITGHENELYHPVWERESFTKTYWLMHPVEHNYVVMSWGERFHYRRSRSRIVPS